MRGGLIHVWRMVRDGAAPNGIISATRGNHGQSLAFAGSRFGLPVTIVVPHGNSVEKNAAIRTLGARLIEHGADFDEARIEPDAWPRPSACGSRRRFIRTWC